MLRGISTCIAVLVLALGSWVSVAHASNDSFINFIAEDAKFEIKGVSADAKYKGWTNTEYISFAVENVVTLNSTGGAGSGKATFKELSLVLAPSEVTQKLFQACAQGAKYKTVQIHIRKPGGAGPYFTMDLSTVYISAVDYMDTDAPKITLVFGAVKITYTPQDAVTGALDTAKAVTSTWSQITNSTNP